MDTWLEFSQKARTGSRCAAPPVSRPPQLVAGAGFEPACKELDASLSSSQSPFLVPSLPCAPSAADLAVWGALCSEQKKWEALKKALPHAAAWHARVAAAQPQTEQALSDYAPAAQRAAKAKLAAAQAAKAAAVAAGGEVKAEAKGGEGGSFEIGLVDAVEGLVCTRFPPEPSGYLHIGHAKAALLNEYFARRYKGTLLLRFDDTNPDKEKEDYVSAILADVATLGIVPDKITYTSDHFDALLAVAKELIDRGVLYADDTPVEAMRAERMDGVESRCRGRSVAENQAAWAEMVAGSEAGLRFCLRFRMSMSDPNKAMRDPVAYRCNVETPHHRTGRRYCVYPTYDCACPYVDAVEGVTHALRTSEYRDREAQYAWIQAAMGLRRVHIWDYSRLNFEYTTLSKRKLAAFVAAGKVDGWDDPRFPTVQGVLRRGLTVTALREFILSQGASKNMNTMTWEKLWTLNKRIIDPVCPRHTAVEAHRTLLTLSGVEGLGGGGGASRAVPRHKKHPPAGEKTQWLSHSVWLDAADAGAIQAGEEVTLMDWGNAVITALQRDGSGCVTALEGRLNLGGDVKKTKLKAHWLADAQAPEAALTPLVLRELDHLITKKKVEDGDDVAALFDEASDSRRSAWGDSSMRALLKKGDVLQLERKGYWIVDEAAAGEAMVLIGIPDGREKKAK